MEKKTIIWHKSTEQPEFVEDLIFMVDDIPYAGTYANGCFYYAPDTNYEQKFTIDRVDSWAYVYQVIATSKALDVARCLLRNIELFGDDDGDRAREALQEIDKIMKGGK